LFSGSKTNTALANYVCRSFIKCVVPENTILPPQKGLEIPGGWGVLKGPKI